VVASDGAALAHILGSAAVPPPKPDLSPEAEARSAAEAVRRACGASYGLAVMPGDPGGHWAAISDAGGVLTRRFWHPGRDQRARIWTTVLALEFLRRLLLGLADGWAQ